MSFSRINAAAYAGLSDSPVTRSANSNLTRPDMDLTRNSLLIRLIHLDKSFKANAVTLHARRCIPGRIRKQAKCPNFWNSG